MLAFWSISCILYRDCHIEYLTVVFSDYVNGGELFTHLNQREHFTETEVKVYIGEIVLALETLHKVRNMSNYEQTCLSITVHTQFKDCVDFCKKNYR